LRAEPGPEELNPKGVQVKLDTKGLRFETNDGTFKFNLGGRLHLDAAGQPGHLPLNFVGTAKADPTDGIEVRRGRIYLGATMLKDWEFLFDIDFADDTVAVKDMLLSYNAFDWGRFTAGSQKQPYSEAVEMSSNDLPFVERGVDNDLIIPFIDRALGGRFDSNGEHWHVALGVYGEGIDPTEQLDEGWGVTGRGVFTPILTDKRVLHLGFRTAYREPGSSKGEAARVRTETTHFSNLFISDTLPIPDTNRVVLYGPEAAFAYGPFSIFGEYNRAYFDAGGGNPNLHFQSGHVGVTWSITGESRAASYTIKSSEFKRLKPHDNFSLKQRTWGAFELATRYAYIDVSDENVRGGREGRMSTSLNWYLNPIVRMMFDWTHVTNGNDGSFTTDTAAGSNILTYRLQFMF
jgi:phosphate-selective porin OprO/OprP